MKRLLLATVFTGSLTLSSTAAAQEIVRDFALSAAYGQGERQIAAYPSVRDPNVYYYIPTRATIPMDRGVPRISFVRFNEKDAEETDEGGIISAYFQLGISDRERERLEEAVQSVNPNAVLRGPIIFDDGSYQLISAVANDAPLIVGAGSAPTHEGDRMYVTAMLTQEGANRLFTTFQTATPSFTVELGMTYKAYRAPIEAILEADFKSIYKSKSFEAAVKAGIANPSAGIMIGADIKKEFDKLRRDGAIKITYIGEDQSQTQAIDAAYEIILNQMFEEVEPSTITPKMSNELNDRASRNYATAVSDREKARKRADAQRTERCRAARRGQSTTGNADDRSSSSGLGGSSSGNDTNPNATARLGLLRKYQSVVSQYEEKKALFETRIQYSGDSLPESHPPIAEVRLAQGRNIVLLQRIRQLLTEARANNSRDLRELGTMENYATFLSNVIEADTRELEHLLFGSEVTNMSVIKAAYQKILNHIDQALPDVQAAINDIDAEPTGGDRPNTTASTGASTVTSSSPRTPRASTSNSNSAEACKPDDDNGDTSLAISAEIRYRIKTSIKELKFVMNMKRSVAESFKASFAADVPDLTRYLNDERVFAKRALDRLAFGQRDIIVDTSELTAADFDSVVSTAGVYLRKEPEISGRQVKTDDIVVTRARIEENPENLRLTYMSDGGNDADLFNQYQYKVDWTLKGGIEIEGEWQDRESAQIPLSPPVKLRTVTISLDPDFVEQENIAAATVRLYSTYGGRTEVQEVQLQPNDQEGSYSTTATIITPRNNFDYEIEKTFTRRGQPTVRTSRAATNDTYLILSDLGA